jgi:hypothetical protein
MITDTCNLICDYIIIIILYLKTNYLAGLSDLGACLQLLQGAQANKSKAAAGARACLAVDFAC